MSKLSVRYAAVAQLDRVFGYEPKGRGFESLQPYQPWTTKSLYTLKASDFNVLTALGCKNPGAAYFCYFPKLAGLEPTQQRCPCRPIQNISTQFPRRSIDLRGRRNGVFLWSFVPASASPPFQTVRMTAPLARWRVWAPAPPPQPSLRACLKSFDKRGQEADNRGKTGGG